jgi:hypothetical protein
LQVGHGSRPTQAAARRLRHVREVLAEFLRPLDRSED